MRVCSTILRRLRPLVGGGMDIDTPKLAVPVFRSRVAPVFNWCSKILLLEEQATSGSTGQEIVLLNMNAFERLRILRSEGVRILICGALSPDLLSYGNRLGFQIVYGVAGDIDEVLQAFQTQKLGQPQFRLPGCIKPCLPRRTCRKNRNSDSVPGARPDHSYGENDFPTWTAKRESFQVQNLDGQEGRTRSLSKGPRGFCTCLHCGLKIRQERGLPCSQAYCPQCDQPLVRQ